jgi:hypothetical protein
MVKPPQSVVVTTTSRAQLYDRFYARERRHRIDTRVDTERIFLHGVRTGDFVDEDYVYVRTTVGVDRRVQLGPAQAKIVR